jgi:sugar phosphate isomerase/epimerase
MRIRFGVCTDLENLPILIDAGYDYIELNLTQLVEMSEEKYEAAKALVDKHRFYAESYNCFFPGSIRLTGPEVDYGQIEAHIRKGLKRAAGLGGKICVIGSGGSRSIPDGFDVSTGYDQFIKVLHIAGDIAAEYGITIVVEALRKAETNLINTVEECIALVKRVNKDNVRALADFYHVFNSGETLDAIRCNQGWLGHLHLARANADRAMPYAEDIPQVEEWAKAVKESGYQGRLSLEGNCVPVFEECVRRTRKIIECFNG